ncbi:MAG: hypothetical protein U0872_06095 [Planctomycetaceae bacterium]
MQTTLRIWLLASGMLFSIAGMASAQQTNPVHGMQFPLNQYQPPETTIEWMKIAGRICQDYMQPVKVYLPGEGRVTFYDHTPNRPIELAAPAQASLAVGRIYRIKVDLIPEYPGVEFYPSIELIDRLHPPPGKIEQFPIEFTLTKEELDWTMDERLVTKVVYLEQPQRVPPLQVSEPRATQTLHPAQNALAVADDLGRPMAIIRLGGRTPDARGMDPQFFGPGGPVQVSQPQPPDPKLTNRNVKTRLPSRTVSAR